MAVRGSGTNPVA